MPQDEEMVLSHDSHGGTSVIEQAANDTDAITGAPSGVAPAGGVDHMRKDPHQAQRVLYHKLSERERDVLRLTAQGYSAPEIGLRLTISPKTVDTYKQRINEKLGFSHRSDYVRFALRLGLLV